MGAIGQSGPRARTAARRQRWHAQLLGGSDLDPVQVVDRAVALQGQNLRAVLTAIALRSRPGTSVADVRAAFDAGALVRSWPMRGTLFVTTPSRLSALLSLTAERLQRAAALRRAQLGLDETLIDRARDALSSALDASPLSRAAAMTAFAGVGIDTSGQRGYHLIAHFAIDGLMHWGPFDESGSEQLLVPSTPSPSIDPDAALTAIVRDCITARAPVTLADIAWWTQLPRSAIARAAAAIPDLVELPLDGVTHWVIGDAPDPGSTTGVTLVPAFDEWVLGYADRGLIAGPEAMSALVPGGNGVFRPAVLVDGAVVGTWRTPPSRSARAPQPEAELISEVSARTARQIDRALAAWPHG